MKIVIDIPERVYTYLTKECSGLVDDGSDSILLHLAKGVIQGTVLPKGHGRLVDENHIIAELVYRKNLLADNVKCGQVTEIFNRAVVIDADMESNNETDN